jgi:predicted permease
MANLLLSIATFAGILLLWGAWKRWRRDSMRQQAVLMVVAALVIFANVAIWVVPDNEGRSLLTDEVK